MKQQLKLIRKVLKKGEYLLILSKAQKHEPELTHNNVIALFNNRVVEENKRKAIYREAKKIYQKRTGKKLERL